MKTLKSLGILSAALFIIGLSSGCKKDKDEPKQPNCKIINVTSSTGDAYTVAYNSDGKISSLTSGSSVTTFAYSGNTAIATTNISGVFDSRKIITTNSDGLAVNIRTENDAAGTVWTNQAQQFNGTEILTSTLTSSSGGSPSVTTFTWSNGNMISATSGGSPTTTLEYDTNKPAQTGDYLHLAQLLAGYEVYRSKNLVKSLMSGATINSFDYSFGTNGVISAITITGGSASTFTYQHQCQ
jgi:hypothetical protein